MRLSVSGFEAASGLLIARLRTAAIALGLCLYGATGHAEPVLTEDVRPQPLATALKALMRQTSLQLVYVSSLAEGRQSPGARAGTPAIEALGQLIDGTDLRFERLNDRTVRLYRRPPAPPAATAALASHAPSPTLDEVVVSATRRDEVLQRVPISASVVTDADLGSYRLSGIADLSAITPGVEYDYSAQFGSGFYTNVAIRGISSDKGASTTGIYVDDTAIEAPHTSFKNPYPSTFDFARVEILRGPQGMLFGRSAEGGAIRFITKEPSTEASDQLYTAGVASTERGGMSVEGGAAAGGPLAPGVLGARVSAWYRHDGGFVDHVDPFTGKVLEFNSNRSERRAFRAALTWQPTDFLRVLPTLTLQSSRVADSPVFYDYLSDPSSGVLLNGKLLRQPTEERLLISALKVEAQLAAMRITSVSSYVDRKATALVDGTNEAGPVIGGYGNPLGPEFPVSYADAIRNDLATRQIMVSQELRAASLDPTATLTWLAGVYLSRIRTHDAHSLYTTQIPDVPGDYTRDDVVNEEVSAYGQVMLALSPKWKTGLGLRAGNLKIDTVNRSGGYANPDGDQVKPGRSHGSLPLTPRFDVSYAENESRFYYGSIARGYRSGSETHTDPPPCALNSPPSFGPDTVWSFELGAKTQFLEDRLRLNASVFHIRWTNLQEHVLFICGQAYTTNAGAAANDGFDLDAEASLSERWRLKLALGYGNIHYTKTVTSPDGTAVADRGTAVGGLPAVPSPWNGTLTVSYDRPVGNDTLAFARAQLTAHSRNSGPFTELNPNSPVYDPRLNSDPATAQLNLHAGFGRNGWTLDFYVDNALDARPVLQRNGDYPGTPLIYEYTFRPRTWGLTATLRR